ncbi:hypothetical protein [Streptomyces sp. NPDC098101]|uniref:hypothetical protein n=1 Tax=Streptomyces sp. NPDC098101 TaxID=3366096 RepID=UPI003802A58A
MTFRSPAGTEVKTFVISESEEPVEVGECHLDFARDRRVQGFVEIRVGGVLILGRENSDTIDALWSLLLAFLEDFLEGGEGALRFPERRYVLGLKRIPGGNVVVKFEDQEERRTALGREKDVLEGLLSGAVDFFGSVLETFPKEEWSYRRDFNTAVRLSEECARIR